MVLCILRWNIRRILVSQPKPASLILWTRDLVNQLKHVNFIPWNKVWVGYLKHIIISYGRWSCIWSANRNYHVYTYYGGSTFWDGQPKLLPTLHVHRLHIKGFHESFQSIWWVWIGQPKHPNIEPWAKILANQPKSVLEIISNGQGFWFVDQTSTWPSLVICEGFGSINPKSYLLLFFEWFIAFLHSIILSYGLGLFSVMKLSISKFLFKIKIQNS